MSSQPVHYDRETNVLIYTDRCSIQKWFWMIYRSMLLHLVCLIPKSMCCAINYLIPPLTEDRNPAVGGFLSEVTREESAHLAVFLLNWYKAIDLTVSSKMLMRGELITLHPLISASRLCICCSYLLCVLHVCSAVVSEKGEMWRQCTRPHICPCSGFAKSLLSSSPFQRPLWKATSYDALSTPSEADGESCILHANLRLSYWGLIYLNLH